MITLAGGPWAGKVEQYSSQNATSFNLIHCNCACPYCARVEAACVAHVYEHRDSLFVYCRSRPAAAEELIPVSIATA